MVMLRTAFDCSKDRFDKYFIMAGFVSSADEWTEFDPKWRARLALDGLPYFHMNPFAHCGTHPQKPFDRTWIGKESRRRALISDLLDLISQHAWRKFGCILPADSLMLFSDIARENFVPTLIATAGRLIWSDVEVWRRREKFQQPARMVFEDGDEQKGSLIDD